MLTKRLIATILLHEGMVVQTKQFKVTNAIGNAKTAIDFFNTWCVDEIVILDISRTDEHHKDFLKIIESFGDKCFVPLAVGGWNRNVQDIRDCLNVGADKVVINTQAYLDSDFIPEAVVKFGSQCIVVSIDIWVRVFVNVGRKITPFMPEQWALTIEKRGTGEIYLTSIERDGMQNGYDLEMIRKISSIVKIPVIASGGCGKWEHLKEAFDAGANAVSVANKFHYSEHSVKEAKEYLMKTGYHVRPAEFSKV